MFVSQNIKKIVGEEVVKKTHKRADSFGWSRGSLVLFTTGLMVFGSLMSVFIPEGVVLATDVLRRTSYDFNMEISGLVPAKCNFESSSGAGISSVSSNPVDGSLNINLRTDGNPLTDSSWLEGVRAQAEGRAGIGIRYVAPKSGRIRIEPDVLITGKAKIYKIVPPVALIAKAVETLGAFLGKPIQFGSGPEVLETVWDKLTGGSVQSWIEIQAYRSSTPVVAKYSTKFLDNGERLFTIDGSEPLPMTPPVFKEILYNSQLIKDSSGSPTALELDVIAGENISICVGTRNQVEAVTPISLFLAASVDYHSGTKVQEIRINYLSEQSTPTPTPTPLPAPTPVPAPSCTASPWSVGQRVSLKNGAEIRQGSGNSYAIHTVVPVDNWPVNVIGGSRCIDGADWWDISRTAIDGGGTGWVNRSQAAYVASSSGGSSSGGGSGYSGPEAPSYGPSFAGQTVSWKGNNFRSDNGSTWIFQGSDAERQAVADAQRARDLAIAESLVVDAGVYMQEGSRSLYYTEGTEQSNPGGFDDRIDLVIIGPFEARMRRNLGTPWGEWYTAPGRYRLPYGWERLDVRKKPLPPIPSPLPEIPVSVSPSYAPSYAPSFAGQTVSWNGNSFRSDNGSTWIFQGSDAERANAENATKARELAEAEARAQGAGVYLQKSNLLELFMDMNKNASDYGLRDAEYVIIRGPYKATVYSNYRGGGNVVGVYTGAGTYRLPSTEIGSVRAEIILPPAPVPLPDIPVPTPSPAPIPTPQSFPRWDSAGISLFPLYLPSVGGSFDALVTTQDNGAPAVTSMMFTMKRPDDSSISVTATSPYVEQPNNGTYIAKTWKATFTVPANTTAESLFYSISAVTSGILETARESFGLQGAPSLITPPVLSESVEPIWTNQFGSILGDNGYGVSVDPLGNVYVAGDTVGALPGQTSSGGNDVFLRKYDLSGNEIWTHQFGSSAREEGHGVSTDPLGNIYVLGSTSGALPDQTNLGGGDVFLRKYDPSGNEVWTRQFGSNANGNDAAAGVSTDSLGSVYVVGYTYGALPGQTSLPSPDAFVRKYDSSGNEVWTRQFGTGGADLATGVAASAAGSVYVAGYTTSAFPGQTNLGMADYFLRKYDPSGNEVWTRQFGTGNYDEALSISADPSGNVYVAGHTVGALPGQTSSGGNDVFLRKYDLSGNEIWTHQFGSSAEDYGYGVSSDPSGNVYVAGDTYGALPGQTSLGDHDAFLRKYDPSGNEFWTRQFAPDSSDSARGVAVDLSGNIYVAGSVTGILPGQTSAGSTDAFLRKYDTQGNTVTSTPVVLVIPESPTCSPGGSFFNAVIVICNGEEGMILRYTTDETAPTVTSAIYSAPLILDATTTLTVAAWDVAENRSALADNAYTYTVLIDVVAPVVNATNASNLWFQVRTTIVSASDLGESDLIEARYNWDNNVMDETCSSGGAVFADGLSLTVPEGSHRLYLCARDGASNVGTWDSGSAMYNVDSITPFVPSLFSVSPAYPEWGNVFNPVVAVTWDAVDNPGGSGVEYYELWRAPNSTNSDGSQVPGVWAKVTSNHNSGEHNDALSLLVKGTNDMPGNGSWWYGLRIFDKAGNWASQSSIGQRVQIDTVVPAKPICSFGTGRYVASVTVACGREVGAIVRYTTNGALPSLVSTQYARSLTFSKTTTLTVIAWDEAGNKSESNQYVYTVGALPNTTIIAMPAMPTNQKTVSFRFTGTNSPLSFECQLDSMRYVPCTSPYSYTVLQGQHTFRVRAKNVFGTDLTPASYAWFLDTTLPTISSFDVQPRALNISNPTATISWTIFDLGGTRLKRVEIWRSSNGGTSWQNIRTLAVPVDFAGLWSSSARDSSLNGNYLYSIHVFDNAGNQKNTAVPIAVKTIPAKPIQASSILLSLPVQKAPIVVPMIQLKPVLSPAQQSQIKSPNIRPSK